MTELLPKEDKVDVSLSNEAVTVPDGKIWSVTIITGLNDFCIISLSGASSAGRLSGDRESMDNTTKGIFHEGTEISATGDTIIVGLQFDYSE